MGENELDSALVERVQQGDKRAFDLLVRKYQHKVIGLVTRYVKNHAECEDVARRRLSAPGGPLARSVGRVLSIPGCTRLR